jgi:hypothetical protein
MDEVLDRVLDTPRMYIGNAEFSDLIDEIQDYDEDDDAENESKTTVGMINKILEGGDIRKVLTTLIESSEKLTWDDICDLADGTAFGDPELKAKDSARAHVDDFAVSRGLPDPEDDEIPEETIEDLCKEYSIRFNDLGEIISFKESKNLKENREYQLVRPSIDKIIDYCNDLLADEKLTVFEFGENNDLVLHIYKDEEFNPDEDKDAFNLVRIYTMQDGEAVDDTEDTYVTDGSLHKELERINQYKDFGTL